MKAKLLKLLCTLWGHDYRTPTSLKRFCKRCGVKQWRHNYTDWEWVPDESDKLKNSVFESGKAISVSANERILSSREELNNKVK